MVSTKSNIFNRLWVYINMFWNKYSDWIIIFIVWLFFYIVGMLTINRLYRFIFILFIVLFYSKAVKMLCFISRLYIYAIIEEKGIKGIYQWLYFFLKLNLYKSILLYILLQINYIACKFLIFINKRFFGNLWAYRFFNILVRHLSLLTGVQVILYKFYYMLMIWATSNPYEIIIKRMYGLIFSILIFSNILYVLKSFIIAYPLLGPYCIIFVIGILYEIPFISNMLKLNCQLRFIYQYRMKGTFIGVITELLFVNYKRLYLDKDITILMNFNNLYFNELLFDTSPWKDVELKFEDLLKYNNLQALCFSSYFYYVEHPHVFSVIVYQYFSCIKVVMLNWSYYYYIDLYQFKIKNIIDSKNLLKVECLRETYIKALKLIIYLIWDMEYYLDNTFNPIDNKSLSIDLFTYNLGSTIYNVKFINNKKFSILKDIESFILKKKGNEIEFFNINLNYSFYEKVFYILNFYRSLNNSFYNNKIFELKVASFNRFFDSSGKSADIVTYLMDNVEKPPHQRDLDYMNNKINIFMNEWLMQRDNDLKESNYKRLKEVEDEMQILMSHEI